MYLGYRWQGRPSSLAHGGCQAVDVGCELNWIEAAPIHREAASGDFAVSQAGTTGCRTGYALRAANPWSSNIDVRAVDASLCLHQ